jgi:hypothetical protein
MCTAPLASTCYGCSANRRWPGASTAGAPRGPTENSQNFLNFGVVP